MYKNLKKNMYIMCYDFWAPLLATSRDPVFAALATFRDCDWCPTGSRLDPDWIPTGSRLDPDWPKAVPKNAKIGARLGPDGILTGSIDWQEPTPAPIFPFPDPPLPLFSFSAHQPCTNTPPLLHQNGKSSLKPNGGFYNICVCTVYKNLKKMYIMCL